MSTGEGERQMKLTKEQKNQIYNKNMIVDDWEWVPCINHVLRILNYDDNLIHDENYETVKWSGTDPLIKDEKIRKAVRAWAEANGIETVKYDEYWVSFRRDDKTISFKDEDRCLGFYELENSEDYTITELCGEEE